MLRASLRFVLGRWLGRAPLLSFRGGFSTSSFAPCHMLPRKFGPIQRFAISAGPISTTLTSPVRNRGSLLPGLIYVSYLRTVLTESTYLASKLSTGQEMSFFTRSVKQESSPAGTWRLVHCGMRPGCGGVSRDSSLNSDASLRFGPWQMALLCSPHTCPNCQFSRDRSYMRTPRPGPGAWCIVRRGPGKVE